MPSSRQDSSLAAWPRSTQKAPPDHAANAEPPSAHTLRGALNGFLADHSVSMRGRAGFSLMLAQQLAQAIDRLFTSDDDPDRAEREAVYEQVADNITADVGIPTGQLFDVLAAACGDGKTEGMDTSSTRLLADKLAEKLVRLTVIYRPSPNGPSTRAVEVALASSAHGLTMRKIESTVPWEALPDDVRESFLKGEKTVGFRLFPGE